MVQKESKSGAGTNNLNFTINYCKLISINFSFKQNKTTELPPMSTKWLSPFQFESNSLVIGD